MKTQFRNFLCVILALTGSLFATEWLLGRTDSVSAETADTQNRENAVIFQMGLRRTPFEDLFSSAVLSLEELRLTPPEGSESLSYRSYKGYPLITDLQNGLSYAEDTFNIVVIGDSFVWGYSSLNRNELFWRVLENDLRAQGYNCRVYGVAMSGANSYDELKWLRESSLVADLQPDLILFGYLYNDPDISKSYQEMLQMGAFGNLYEQNRIPTFLQSAFPNICTRLSNYIAAKTLYTSSRTYVSAPIPAPILKGVIRDAFEKKFMEPLENFFASSGIPVVLMTLPIYQGEQMQKALYQPLQEICSQYPGIDFRDSTDAFFRDFTSARHAKNYSVNITDLHPGSATHYFYAKYIEEFLKKDYAAILGKPFPNSLSLGVPVLNEAMPPDSLPVAVAQTARKLVCTVTYPSLVRSYSVYGLQMERNYLTLPLGKDYIALSFAEPAELASIEISSPQITSAEVYYQSVNESLGYDDHSLKQFVSRPDGVWENRDEDRVTMLLIHAECRNDDGAELTVAINF